MPYSIIRIVALLHISALLWFSKPPVGQQHNKGKIRCSTIENAMFNASWNHPIAQLWLHDSWQNGSVKQKHACNHLITERHIQPATKLKGIWEVHLQSGSKAKSPVQPTTVTKAYIWQSPALYHLTTDYRFKCIKECSESTNMCNIHWKIGLSLCKRSITAKKCTNLGTFIRRLNSNTL